MSKVAKNLFFSFSGCLGNGRRRVQCDDGVQNGETLREDRFDTFEQVSNAHWVTFECGALFTADVNSHTEYYVLIWLAVPC